MKILQIIFFTFLLVSPSISFAQVDYDRIAREIQRQGEEAQSYADSVRRFIGDHIANAYDEQMRNELVKYDQMIVDHIRKEGARSSKPHTTHVLNLAKRAIADGEARYRSSIAMLEELERYESLLPEFINQENLIVNSWEDAKWPFEDNSAEYAAIENNRYYINVLSKTHWHYFTVPLELNNFQNFYIETSLQSVKSSNDYPFFGLMWGASGANDANLFLIDPTEKIFTIGGVNFNEVDLPNYYASNHINHDRNANTIGIMNHNNSTVYFINRKAVYFTNRKEMIGNEFGFFVEPNNEIVANRFNVFLQE